MRPLRISVVTGSRADYGLLYWLMKEIDADPQCELLVAATGMHLAPEFGLTYRIIEEDGFHIAARVDSLLAGDTPEATAKSIGLGVVGFADVFARTLPDWVIVLGDRYEIYAAAQAAYVARIPLAHIAGGDVTEGSYDEAFRHGITKMSSLHFVTNLQAKRRVEQLGEDPARVLNVGSPGLDYIRKGKFLERPALERELDLDFRKTNLLITFHPATLEAANPEDQFGELLAALHALPSAETRLIITKPNADTGGRALITMVDQFVATHENARAFTSLGQKLYLSLMNEVDAIVGNSSSGVYEAPSFGKATVNIGDRQKGRLLATSVINCLPERHLISAAIAKALRSDFSNTQNPYGDGQASSKILNYLKGVADPESLTRKRFVDLPQQ
jgi:UDP-hydrolysing UDP-N-acetyl-D-glucosamine 2-epimerase